jgi:hypothetical protein
METIYEKILRLQREPDHEEILQYIKESGDVHSYYSAREELRQLIYGGKVGGTPPSGFSSWGRLLEIVLI